MDLFQRGNFVLNSGAVSKWRLECDALTSKDIECLAYLMHIIVGPFSSVEGVPRGGLALAEALKSYASLEMANYPHIIVDDVLTTGGSMERVRKKWEIRETGREGIMPARSVKGMVVFARGKCPYWIRPLMQLPEELWVKG